jgi:nucleoid-associated protein YgaU
VVHIRYIGVWDTVKSIGDPLLGDQDDDGEYDAAEFYDHDLRASVHSARHAIALDERRKKFNVTPWDNIDQLNEGRGFKVDDPERPFQQLWFPGGHGSVGGGGDIKGLSDEGLEWVLEGAKRAGLALDVGAHSKVWAVRPDVLAPLENSSEKSWHPRDVAMRMLPKKDRDGPSFVHEVAQATIVRWGAPVDALPEGKRYRPASLRDIEAQLDQAARFDTWEYDIRGGYADPGAVISNVRTSDGREFRRYVVKPADSLSKIAKALLGDPKREGEILALNRTTIMDPARIYAGQVLNVPLA